MKIALCLSGYFGTISTNDMSTAFGGHDHLTAKVLNNENVDVFIHNWQPELKIKIEKLYRPTCSVFEKQITFKDNYESQTTFDGTHHYDIKKMERVLSFYYSRCEAMKLCFEHEKKYDFKYDWVITTRFDISQHGGREVNQLRFDPKLDNSYFYTTFWNQINAGYGDMWIYSGSDVMKIYSKIYSQALQDFQYNSSYYKELTGGWFDSNRYEQLNSDDQRQFTNELLKPKSERSTELMRFSKDRLIDSHLHHKWFAKANHLYEITKWI